MSWRALLALGLLLLCASVAFLLGRDLQSLAAGKTSSDTLSALAAQIPDAGSPGASSPSTPEVWSKDREMPTVRVGDYDYIGTLALPMIDIEVPVASECDDARLSISPCRYAGSYYDDDLIICGEGYRSHFGLIGGLGIRDEVRLRAADGTLHRYVVSNIETDRLEDIDAIMDDWDLTLFTFNSDDTCCVVRCVRM